MRILETFGFLGLNCGGCPQLKYWLVVSDEDSITVEVETSGSLKVSYHGSVACYNFCNC